MTIAILDTAAYLATLAETAAYPAVGADALGSNVVGLYRSIVLGDRPSGYWRLDDAAGQTGIADSSGNGGVLTTWTYGGAGSIIKDSVGNYHAVLDTTGQSGTWTYEWQGTGGAVTGTPTAFSSFLATPAPL